ncbi:hypothetical protein BUL40_09335 [Croceivirga radicis]|uniref:Glycosyltransferase 2-like domain-containing protein n=1 Tax=Croceivirga radicis TaxID=1929488 RepID=A0A1V6LRA3_9FLAO|nr:glycosyltransferase family A protein [Croceivirga radicis]OQD42714.1 hypothetical protein BUL40_09335 [Croceivirga radicis]
MKSLKTEKYKISFCTVCMNRLSFLKQTLPKNIEDNLSYGNVEFVVLNYNSKDGMDEWIRREMKDYMDSGVLKYIWTRKPKYFLMSHSKNVAHKNASGDIVCNVDADNFIGRGFAEYINTSFLENANVYMAGDILTSDKGGFGRICMTKSDFVKLQGYDENMKGYGFEDHDMRNRLELLGRKVKIINKAHLTTLEHDDILRLENEPNTHHIKEIYFKNIDHATTGLLYLLDDQTFFKGNIVVNALYNSLSIDNLFKENRNQEIVRNGMPREYRNRLENDEWTTGEYSRNNKGLKLFPKQGKQTVLVENGRMFQSPEKGRNEIYHKVWDNDLFMDLVMFFSQINNRIKTKKNLEGKVLTPNKGSFGYVTLNQHYL